MDPKSRKLAAPRAWWSRVATGGEMGRRIGVVGRGCIPGGIGAEKRAASHERLAYSRSGGEKPVKTGIIRKVPVRSPTRSFRIVLAKNAETAKKRLRCLKPLGELGALCERNSSARISDQLGNRPAYNRISFAFIRVHLRFRAGTSRKNRKPANFAKIRDFASPRLRVGRFRSVPGALRRGRGD